MRVVLLKENWLRFKLSSLVFLCDHFRYLPFNVTVFQPQRTGNAFLWGIVYFYLSSLCNRTHYTWYGNILVGLRSDCHFAADSDRRHGSYYCGRILCNDFRAEDFFDAAQYHAGSDFSAKGRGNSSPDWLYRQGTLVMELLCAAVMAPVFCRDFGKKGLWMALFHSVSAFATQALICWCAHSIFLPDKLCSKSSHKLYYYVLNCGWRYWLSDLGWYSGKSTAFAQI